MCSTNNQVVPYTQCLCCLKSSFLSFFFSLTHMLLPWFLTSLSLLSGASFIFWVAQFFHTWIRDNKLVFPFWHRNCRVFFFFLSFLYFQKDILHRLDKESIWKARSVLRLDIKIGKVFITIFLFTLERDFVLRNSSFTKTISLNRKQIYCYIK